MYTLNHTFEVMLTYSSASSSGRTLAPVTERPCSNEQAVIIVRILECNNALSGTHENSNCMVISLTSVLHNQMI